MYWLFGWDLRYTGLYNSLFHITCLLNACHCSPLLLCLTGPGKERWYSLLLPAGLLHRLCPRSLEKGCCTPVFFSSSWTNHRHSTGPSSSSTHPLHLQRLKQRSTSTTNMTNILTIPNYDRKHDLVFTVRTTQSLFTSVSYTVTNCQSNTVGSLTSTYTLTNKHQRKTTFRVSTPVPKVHFCKLRSQIMFSFHLTWGNGSQKEWINRDWLAVCF